MPIGETSLVKLLATLKPTLTTHTFVFVTLAPSSPKLSSLLQSSIMTFRENEGVTLILPEDVAAEHQLHYIYRSRQIILDVHSSLDAVGFMAHIATKLAGEGFSVNPVSAYYHDHLFVKADDAEAVMKVLRRIRRTLAATLKLMGEEYRGGSSVDPLHVMGMCAETQEALLAIGVNLMFDPNVANGSGEADDIIWRKRAKDYRQTLTLNGRLYPFYTVPNTIRMDRSGDDSLEVEARFFSTSTGQFFQAYQYFSPLADDFWDRLTSPHCAAGLHRGDLGLGRRLVTFDLLDATIMSHIRFIQWTRDLGAWKPPEYSNGVPEKETPLVGDLELISDFSKAVRDLVQSSELCVESIELAAKFDDQCRRSFDELKLRSKNRRAVLKNTMEDLKSDMDAFILRGNNLLDKRQATSLKLLTLVASIFLPLTMACSLLSMSTRFNVLGPLLWDWAGIVITLGTIVLIAFRMSLYMQKLKHEPASLRMRRTVEEEFRRAKAKALSTDKKTRAFRQTHLIPWTSRFLFRLTSYLFIAAAIGSFLVGMFADHGNVGLGARSLGFSAAGAVGFLLLGFLVYRLTRWLVVDKLWEAHVRKARERKNNNKRPHESDSNLGSGEASMADVNSSLRNSTDEEAATGSAPFPDQATNNSATDKHDKKESFRRRFAKFFIKSLIIAITRPLTLVVLPGISMVISFFFGPLILKVLIHVALKLIQLAIPDDRNSSLWNIGIDLVLRGIRREYGNPDEPLFDETDDEGGSNGGEERRGRSSADRGPESTSRSRSGGRQQDTAVAQNGPETVQAEKTTARPASTWSPAQVYYSNAAQSSTDIRRTITNASLQPRPPARAQTGPLTGATIDSRELGKVNTSLNALLMQRGRHPL
ncbi:uncharacterized protein AB675_4775 [Cyphellophora attinorum]|uniref:DUF2241 domain-containing protein n=1 Tax=Cyphellophora attinorum TaxID=1664694 RepID=A0A0N0NIE8_9EURO|nr:uncharacterized protein AB675_4775 [Phialophora attinorum]KPI35658.1 hypothetical protein AB675_4775 [Phialophora attinorum]